jgi:hypothetical protein
VDADDGDDAEMAAPAADEAEWCRMVLRLIDAVSGRVCNNGGAFTLESGVGKNPSWGA